MPPSAIEGPGKWEPSLQGPGPALTAVAVWEMGRGAEWLMGDSRVLRAIGCSGSMGSVPSCRGAATAESLLLPSSGGF